MKKLISPLLGLLVAAIVLRFVVSIEVSGIVTARYTAGSWIYIEVLKDSGGTETFRANLTAGHLKPGERCAVLVNGLEILTRNIIKVIPHAIHRPGSRSV